MSYVINGLSLIVVLGVLVFLHEGGHFLAARAVRARVSVFSLGFGKRLFGFSRGGTDYRVSLIPLGGYVRIHGLGPDESDVVGAEAAPEPLLPRPHRAAILLAGPAANLVSAVLFLTLAYVIGVPVPAWQDTRPEIAWVDPSSPAAQAGLLAGDVVVEVDGRPVKTWRELELSTWTSPGRALTVRFLRGGEEHSVSLTPRSITSYELGYSGIAPPLPAEIHSLMPGSAAEQAGLRVGDRIVSVDGVPVRHFYDLLKYVSASPGREITLGVERGGQRLEIRATPRDMDGQGKLGIPAPDPTVVRRLGPLAALAEAGRESVRITRETFIVLGRMISGRASLKQMSGPIEIARFSGQAARRGVEQFIWLLGMISLQLAIFNLLPIPVLDGGHLAITAFETGIRRDLSIRAKERILTVGFWLIVGLMVVVLYNDLAKNMGWDGWLPGRARATPTATPAPGQ
ncbi:MAG TPA: RIP metalloprotease RseP [Thermoanaerobaculaceae bacterium]|nr:RIP metalloprotease RseP [Thermoanaerobaculaceae bacterium]HRS15611.1 RIP metalloprotease RseP [Thermoanaerobaculaceae bacterium]